MFESGALNADGSIQGNDNDEDASRFEPHYTEITRPDQVQIYESVMAGADGRLTTGLLTALAVREGQPAAAARVRQAHGRQGHRGPRRGRGGRRLRRRRRSDPLHRCRLRDAQGPFSVEAELWYQPIAYRWAMNLRDYDAPSRSGSSGTTSRRRPLPA